MTRPSVMDTATATGTATETVKRRASSTGASTGTRVNKFRLLVISSDPYPPTRVDGSVLFGEELAGRGHKIDYILQSEAHCEHSYVASWGGGRAWVAAANHG